MTSEGSKILQVTDEPITDHPDYNIKPETKHITSAIFTSLVN